METREPSGDDMRRAQEQQQAAEEARAEKADRVWREQAEEIEGISADAVERAAAMGDKVEPSIPPPGGRTWHDSDEHAADDARRAVVDPDDRDEPRHGGSTYSR